MRVHALAKAVGVTSKEVIAALAELGVVVTSASSSVGAEDRNRFLDAVAGSGSLDDGRSGESAAVEVAAAEEKPAEETAEKAEEKPAAKKAARKASRKTAKKTAKKATKKTAAKAAEKAEDKPAEKPVEKAEPEAAEKTDNKPVEDAPKSEAPKATAEADASAPNEAAQNDAAEEAPKKATRRSRSRRAAKRAASKPAAPAKKADEVEVEETIVADAAAESVPAESAPAEPAFTEPAAAEPASAEDDHLVEIVPPVTPPPAEPAFAVPVFMAPEPIEVISDGSADSSSDANVDATGNAADESGDSDRTDSADSADSDSGDDANRHEPRPRRRRRGRGRGRGGQGSSGGDSSDGDSSGGRDSSGADSESTKGRDEGVVKQDNARRGERDDNAEPEVPVVDEPVAIKGSTRLEAQRRRRADRRAESRKRHVISEAEFLARRESVERTMVVRERRRHDGDGMVTQVGVLEDDLLVEHFVTSDTQTSIIGDIYLGRVQNVLPSMEAAFIDIGTDRNGVLYSADVNWRSFGASGRSRRIEHALKAGDQVLVQVTKDPVGHKGARLSMQISLAGRFLVYVPGGHSAGISRKLPEPERKRLKEILKEVTPQGSGTIIRTAAEGVTKEAIAADVNRLEGLWRDIDKRTAEAKSRKGAKPLTMYEEPDMLIKVVRDLFNEDFSRLVVEGDKAWGVVRSYVDEVAPDLSDRLQRYHAEQHGGEDVFAHHRIDEQLAKALDRKVWLPSGGTLIIERTEAMTVIDVNTGKFTGAGGNLEETVTRNNLEAAEEIVRQMRLRDLGGMIVVDFIDMVLPENQDLVLRRLKEALGRDRTRHEVSEVTSLGLVQMTRKRLGTGLLETFSTTCEACNGRGLIIHVDPVDHEQEQQRGRRRGRRNQPPGKHPAAEAMHRKDAKDERAEDSAKDSDDSVQEEQLDDGSRGSSSGDRERDGGSGRRRGRRRGSRRGGSGQGSGQGRDAQVEDRAEEMSEEERAVDESVTRAESEESRPPRRRRRGRRSSSRGRGGADESRGADESGSDDAKANRREASRDDRDKRDNRDERTDDGDALARLAADAVAEARDKDPDEPSDDRYVSRSARRRRRRRVVHAAQQAQGEQPGDKSQGGQAKGEQAQGGQQDGRAERAGRASSKKATTDVSETPERTVSVDSKPKRGADDAPAEPQTYEEALEAFEKSPRRNRPTRGRSRSDHAPKPEDFGVDAGRGEATADAKGAGKGSDDEGSKGKGSKNKGSKNKGSGAKSSGRKGSSRKSSGNEDSKAKASETKSSKGKGSNDKSSDDNNAKSADKKSSDKQGSNKKGSDNKGSDNKGSGAGRSSQKSADNDGAKGKDEATGSNRPARRRGRRRVVRRTAADAPADAAADAPKAKAPKKTADKKATSSGNEAAGEKAGVAKQDGTGNKARRGRRRVVRRTARG
ncbi:translation initiation factor IF-2 N-terminal domain-containing protein [Corynebacterium freneyi]|uniref:translation initiation factor IF-2 N-terminal domain-containing protein n=1 Tax=Corynebacterium freneyi TaxID=134034 RepID=UPI00396C7DD0